MHKHNLQYHDTCPYCDSFDVRMTLVEGSDSTEYEVYCRGCGETWIEQEDSSFF